MRSFVSYKRWGYHHLNALFVVYGKSLVLGFVLTMLLSVLLRGELLRRFLLQRTRLEILMDMAGVCSRFTYVAREFSLQGKCLVIWSWQLAI